MKLQFNSEAAAADAAQTIHAKMIEAKPAYAASVLAGETMCWDTPRLVGGMWCVSVSNRCAHCLPDGLTMDDAKE